MANKEIAKQISAAIFLLMGIVAIFLFILTVGKDKGLTESKFQVSILFRNVGGLSEGAPVRLSGVNVGNVASINFLDKELNGRTVNVKLNIYTKYKKQLNESTSVAIKTEGVLGEKLVEIDAIQNESKINFNQPVIGHDPLEVSDVAEVLMGAAQSFSKTSEELSRIDMVELTDVMTESSRALLITSEGLNNIMTELQEIARKLKRMFDRIEQRIIEGDLFSVF